ncbi:MAG: methylenetetrahydrofolate--tRNA-(uracil(54)-C(5))-methyltransferase (FADH(2)-oxidizing) TrmFO [Deltaproteobacteria bacterium]|nr:MAG: methylenetetrahydrofolate--tRNA-(uracil(54)-C(5))-methyltransferase (FADH(2)-oxidizing) TrmFO [Deltaproteobacteria bacterium]
MNEYVSIIGGGLAGCEAAWQLACREIPVVLFEMRPHRFSPAHESEHLAELVCSNSLRSNQIHSAVGLLKEEMRRLDSLIMSVADNTAVPAGKALAVDRNRFALAVTSAVNEHPLIELRREEVTSLDATGGKLVIIAGGPLSSRALTDELRAITGGNLSFYDAIAPVVATDSLDADKVYRKSRWDDDSPGDYLNCPFSKKEYERFYEALISAQTVPLKSFEQVKYFEGCLPIEVMAGRGEGTLRFGPMKPVGLAHPVTGEVPYAVVQLRAENVEGSMYNLVGFQTKLTYGEQKRVFRLIPGLEKAEFIRLGSIHRNTFLCSPLLLDDTLQLVSKPGFFVTGQLSGVEGYVESAAMGLLSGLYTAMYMRGQKPVPPPRDTAMGSLVYHLTTSDPRHFQPSNVNFGLFPALNKKLPRKERGTFRSQQALNSLENWKVEARY